MNFQFPLIVGMLTLLSRSFLQQSSEALHNSVEIWPQESLERSVQDYLDSIWLKQHRLAKKGLTIVILGAK